MKPLTIEQLKSLEVGDWVWIIHHIGANTPLEFYAEIVGHGLGSVTQNHKSLVVKSRGSFNLYYSDYGTKWLAYKNKEQAESKGEIVELPCAVGDMVYWNNGVRVAPYRVDGFSDYNDGMGMRLLIGEIQPSLLLVGENLFFDKSEAERCLAELRGEK